jgi:hypothetical protein
LNAEDSRDDGAGTNVWKLTGIDGTREFSFSELVVLDSSFFDVSGGSFFEGGLATVLSGALSVADTVVDDGVIL